MTTNVLLPWLVLATEQVLMVSWTWLAMSGNGALIGTEATIVEALEKILKGVILAVNAC